MAEILNIKKAVERKLSQVAGSVPTAHEGVEFVPPVNAMYQRTQLVFKDPDDPSFPIGYHRENLQFQIFICDIKGKGTATALTRAELLRTTFHKGWSTTEGNVLIRSLETPKIGSVFITNDRVVVPVLIDLTCEVNT
jgi:hypothetical protein